MQLEEVRVRRFRNIRDTGWVDVHEDVTTLVGKNESGKTSFLEAVGRLSDTDPIEDDDINNRLDDIDDSFPIVQAKFSGSVEVDDFSGTVESGGGVVHKQKDGKLRVTGNLGLKSREVILRENAIRHIEDRLGVSHEEIKDVRTKHRIENQGHLADFNEGSSDLDAESIVNSIDKITYRSGNEIIKYSLEEIYERLKHDDPDVVSVVDIMPSINFSSNIEMVNNSRYRENLVKQDPFQQLLSLGGINHKKFHNYNNKRKLMCRKEAQEEIESRLNDFWNQKSIDIRLRYDDDDDEFLWMIEDTNLSERASGESLVDRSLTLPSNRSRGFQWFLSFFVDQVAREEGDEDNTIYLIDDPAVYLHPEGKKNWLETIESLTDDAQFVYSSHSPFLIDETRPERIRIVEDRPDDRTQITDDIFEGDRETLEPLRHTLGIGLGDSPFVSRRKILVEGPSDYFILTAVLNYFEEHETDTPLSGEEVTLYPVDGADEMLDAGRWMHSEEFAFAFLLDNDPKGKDVESDIEDDELLNENRVFFLGHDRAKSSFNVEIEDMFHPGFYVDCVNEVYGRESFREEIEGADSGPDDLSELDSIEVTEADEEGWLLDGEQEYKGMKIVTKIEDAFDEQGYGSLDLDKVRVAKQIQKRLQADYELCEEDVAAFKRVLGPMNSTLYD